MGKYDAWDQTFCGFDCGTISCTRNKGNVKLKDQERTTYTMFEECREYTPKSGLDEKDQPYDVQDLAKIKAVTDGKK